MLYFDFFPCVLVPYYKKNISFYRVKGIIAPYLQQLQPGAGKDMIKACSKLAFSKVRKSMGRKKHKSEKSYSSSSESSSYSDSSSYTSDEDMFEERSKKKTKTRNRPTTSSNGKNNEEKDPLGMSDSMQSETD